jgi:hypothetical protein
VIPVVLGSSGEVLDWGRERRFFSGAQTKRLWLRDGGCTYPGCDAPPQWADGHHLVHWADGGPSDLSNAALLCERHHTIVHTRRLAGRVVRKGASTGSGRGGHGGRGGDGGGRGGDGGGDRVEWDLTRGSYDDLLARRTACDTETEPA